MARKRLTQVFPFLLPLRRWQRKQFFYYNMKKDGCRYAKEKSEQKLPNLAVELAVPMLNRNSGFAMKYQVNKVHNLKIAARTINGIVIRPYETFSFWQLVRLADHEEKYKDALVLVDGQIVPSYGGGLCMLSDMLFLLFLHLPLAIVERHGHVVKAFPETTEKIPAGVDAAVAEGWLDLKVRNETENTFQIVITFDEQYMYGRIFAQIDMDDTYEVFNSSVSYQRKGEKVYQMAVVCRKKKNRRTGRQTQEELYRNLCEIGYRISGVVPGCQQGVPECE